MLHLKYAPTNLSECVVNRNIVKQLPKYLNDNNINTVALINGMSGSGKTLTTKLIIQTLKIHITEINFSNKITKDYISEKINNTKHTILVFEEANLYEKELINALNIYFTKKKSRKKIIIISDSEFSNSKFNYNVMTTQISNIKEYTRFIKNIIKKENIKIKKISNYVLKNGTNIRKCINNLVNLNGIQETFHDENNEEMLNKLSENITITEKYNLILNNFVNIQYIYFENICSYEIDIKKRILFSKTMVFCDQFNTLAYTSQNWDFLNYIIYCSTIKSSIILPPPTCIIKNPTIWSSYSNLCCKMNKLYILYMNNTFLYNFNIVKNIKYKLLDAINNNDVNIILQIISQYNITSYTVLTEILQVGLIKKEHIKNIKILKKIVLNK